MNKQDLIGKVAEITGMQKSDSEKAVNAVFDQITDVLKQRGEVRLVGFGTVSYTHLTLPTNREV